MFRPNRIGTPNILAATDVSSTAGWTPTEQDINSLYAGNVINAVPVADFGQSALRWTGSEAVAAFKRICIGQQFTVTPPLSGDVVGMELGGSIEFDYPTTDLLFPVLFKCTAAGAAIFDSVTTTGPHSVLAPTKPVNAAIRQDQYRTQAVSQLGAGTYFHGFALQDAGAGFTITVMSAEFYTRQLNDQQSVGYRDTLR